jgi:DNA topoisomerase-1
MVMKKKASNAAPVIEIITDPIEAAEAASLTYVDVSELRGGITRNPHGKTFRYYDPEGHPIRDKATIARINALVIPPAWTDVWICPDESGHIQAVGRDAKGRKQYRYHAQWREVRNQNKFNRMIAFGEALPTIRQRVEQDLKKQGLPREKVLALVVQLLGSTFIRIGNAEYVKQNNSFGLTTMQDDHVEVSGSHVQFEFRGKSGKTHSIHIHDRRLASLVKRCRDIPGQHLFQYLDSDGNHQSISSTDVNVYLHEISGETFTAKDFRTWGGTVIAMQSYLECGLPHSETEAKKMITRTVKSTAAQLGNTPAVCSKYYLHPAITESYMNGTLFDIVESTKKKFRSDSSLSLEEQIVLAVLREQTMQQAPQGK